MKLTIENLDKFNKYADVWFKANSSINRKFVVSKLSDKYMFHLELYGMSFDIHLLRTQDFMPGWPVEVWAFNEKLKMWSKLSETNARENQITSKADWCIYVKDLIEWAWNNNHKNLR
jgi:hypothetical protein